MKSDTSPRYLMDSTMSPKVKTIEKKGVGVHSLARSTSRVEVHFGVPGSRLGRLKSNSITHTNLHKLNNKLVSA
jgi:hypothetical protein